MSSTPEGEQGWNTFHLLRGSPLRSPGSWPRLWPRVRPLARTQAVISEQPRRVPEDRGGAETTSRSCSSARTVGAPPGRPPLKDPGGFPPHPHPAPRSRARPPSLLEALPPRTLPGLRGACARTGPDGRGGRSGDWRRGGGPPVSPRPVPSRPPPASPLRLQNGGGGRVPAGRGFGAARKGRRIRAAGARRRPGRPRRPQPGSCRRGARGSEAEARLWRRDAGGREQGRHYRPGLAEPRPGARQRGEGRREGEGSGRRREGSGRRELGGAEAPAGRLRVSREAASPAGGPAAPSPVGSLPAEEAPVEGGPPRRERPSAGRGRGGRLLPGPSLSLASAILLRSRRPGDACRHPRSRRPCPHQPQRESRPWGGGVGGGGGSERAPLPRAHCPLGTREGGREPRALRSLLTRVGTSQTRLPPSRVCATWRC